MSLPKTGSIFFFFNFNFLFFVFALCRFHRFALDFQQEEWTKMNSDILAEQYTSCGLTVNYGYPNSTKLEGLGCRYKGAMGSLQVCIDPRTGKPIAACRKLSIKIDANLFRYNFPKSLRVLLLILFTLDLRDDGQEIFGQKRMLLHGMPVDWSLFAERTSYNLFQQIGTAAPRAAHAKLWINQVYDGVYALIEEVNDDFTKHHFGDDLNKGKGALYKSIWLSHADPAIYLEYQEHGKVNEEVPTKLFINFRPRPPLAHCFWLSLANKPISFSLSEFHGRSLRSYSSGKR